MIVVIVSLLAAVQLTPGAERGSRERTVREFLGLMAAASAPTIADFDRFFGPHNEDELALQLRTEGARDPLRNVPDEATVERVNRRLQSPSDHPSLFLRCVRRHVRELSPSIVGGVVAADVVTESPGVVRVSTRLGSAWFRFPDTESYFSVAVRHPEASLGVASFLHDCRRGSCCE